MTEQKSTNPSDESSQADQPRMKLSLRQKNDPTEFPETAPEESVAEEVAAPTPPPPTKVKLKLSTAAASIPAEEPPLTEEPPIVEEPLQEQDEPLQDEPPAEERPEDPIEEPAQDAEKLPLAAAAPPTPKAAKGGRGLLKLMLIAAVMMLGLLGIAYWLLTVLVQPGEKAAAAVVPQQSITAEISEPVVEPNAVAVQAPEPMAGVLAEPVAEITPVPQVAPEVELQLNPAATAGQANSFIESLTGSDLLVTLQPLGVFIGPVWFAEGAVIDPERGLRISAIATSDEPSISISAADGSVWQIPAKR